MKRHSGLVKCKTCGEYKGKCMAKELDWDSESPYRESNKIIVISCICDGILCLKCGKNRIHRPVSNSYDLQSNTVQHWPYFTGMMGCKECREKNKVVNEKQQDENQAPALTK